MLSRASKSGVLPAILDPQFQVGYDLASKLLSGGPMLWVDLLGYVAAACVLATYSMKTMIPLRVLGICGNLFFIAYGYAGSLYPNIILHTVLLPLNGVRLYQMLLLVERVKTASRSDLSMEWLEPFMSKRTCRAGDVIFRRGDVSSAMFYTVTGKYRLKEIATEIPPGQVIGEIGLIAPDNKRTLTFECIEDGDLLTITYSQVKQLYFQNPKFGFYFLQLISQRLFKDIERLEQRVSQAA
jgi:CRP/FNR family transcriptional regulator, cyclic AMP receptor protein